MTARRRTTGGLLAAGLVLFAGCGGGAPTEAPVTTTGCIVSAPAGFDDASIGQLSFGELSNAHEAGFLGATSAQRVSTAEGTRRALERYAEQGCSLSALVGPGGAEALADVADDAPDTAWLAVATGGEDYPDNVLTIDFDLLEPAFIAGYAAAARSDTGRVAVFASRGFASGDQLLRAFDAGVEQRNVDTDSEVVSLHAGTTAARTVDDTPAAGRSYADEAVAAEADVIVPFASGAASGVLETFAAHYSSLASAPPADDPAEGVEDEESEPVHPTLVWYGTDGSRTLDEGLDRRVVASIVPNVAAGFQSTVAGWPETGFAGPLETASAPPRTVGGLAVRAPEYTGTVANGGVELVASDGLLSSVAGVGRDIAEVQQRIRSGEIELPDSGVE
jgi:basic membrane protein A and related proteins